MILYAFFQLSLTRIISEFLKDLKKTLKNS